MCLFGFRSATSQRRVAVLCLRQIDCSPCTSTGFFRYHSLLSPTIDSGHRSNLSADAKRSCQKLSARRFDLAEFTTIILTHISHRQNICTNPGENRCNMQVKCSSFPVHDIFEGYEKLTARSTLGTSDAMITRAKLTPMGSLSGEGCMPQVGQKCVAIPEVKTSMHNY